LTECSLIEPIPIGPDGTDIARPRTDTWNNIGILVAGLSVRVVIRSHNREWVARLILDRGCRLLAADEFMDNAVEKLGAPDSLKRNLEWYIANQKELAAKYNGKILLIVDQKLVKAFDDMAQAFTEASKAHEPGTYTLQPCSPDPDSYTLMLYSPMYSVFG
jgi:hypothetical protein